MKITQRDKCFIQFFLGGCKVLFNTCTFQVFNSVKTDFKQQYLPVVQELAQAYFETE